MGIGIAGMLFSIIILTLHSLMVLILYVPRGNDNVKSFYVRYSKEVIHYTW